MSLQCPCVNTGVVCAASQSGAQSSAVAALECLLSWLESHCLAVVGVHHHRRPPRRPLVSSNCTLLSDPDTDTASLSESVLVSDASLVGRPDVSTNTRNFAKVLIKVGHSDSWASVCE